MENDIFGGFTAVAQSISDKASIDASHGDDDDLKLPGAEDLEGGKFGKQHRDIDVIETDEDADPIPEKDPDEEEEVVEEEEEEEIEPLKDVTEPSTDEGLGEAEEEIAGFLQEKLFEKFGIEADDDTEEFKSIDDVVEFVKAVVEENSTPTYASEELAMADEFVKNGGNLKDFLEAANPIDFEKIDIDSYNDQKKVIRELLKTKGYADSRIEKAIERYEDAGVLQEEAEDALELLEDYREEHTQKLLEEQKRKKEYVIQEQQKYIENVKNEIETLNDIRGIPISKKEKQELFEYIFKPTRTGQTRYQEDYVKSQRNMIESAFFTMKGDAFVQKVQKKATSEAASRLRKKLANKGARGRNQTGQGGSSISDVWSIASKELRSSF